MNRPLLWVGVCTFLAAVGTIAFAQAPDQAQRPTFQVSVNYVDVDVTVTDAQGNFVTGLTRDDFQLLEDGKPQKIDTFSFVELPVERPSRFLALGRPIQADVRSNRDASSGRVYIIVLDDLNVSAMRTAIVRRSAREFVDKYFGPHDIAAVVSTSGNKELSQEFTNDPAMLLKAIDRFIGQRLRPAELERLDDYFQSQLLSGLDAPAQTEQEAQNGATVPNLLTRMQSFDPSNLERGQRAIGVLNTLRNLAAFLEGVRGRRKALLWFSEGIDYPMAEVFSSQSGTEITQATKDVINAAAHANVNFFALDPRGLIGMTTDLIGDSRAGAPDTAGNDPTKPAGTPFSGTQALLNEMRLTQDSLRTLAEGTGGFAAVDTNVFADAFSRIVDTNSRYYLLGYTAPNHPRDGRFHRIEVRVNRPGVKAVARRGYPSPSGRTAEERRRDEMNRRALENRKGGSADTSAELRLALNNPVQQAGLTLAVQAIPLKNTPKEAAVALTVEIDGKDFEFAQQPNSLFANSLELSFFTLTDEGKAQRGTRSALNIAVRPETYQRMKALGIRYNARMPLAPGRYQLRVGARDPLTGKAGTVFYDVVVPDFSKPPLTVSGLLLSSTGALQMFTAQHDPMSEKLLGGGPPTTRREFGQNETLAWMTEIYDNMPADRSRRIDVRASLIGENGQVGYSSNNLIANGGANGWTTFGYTGQIPLNLVQPGRYVLRLQATPSDGGNPATTETMITVKN